MEGPNIERRHRVDADAPFAVGSRLIERDDAGIGLDDVQQVVAVTHMREACLLFVGRQSRHVVDRSFLDARDVALHPRRQR
jgi:hypothetical protein